MTISASTRISIRWPPAPASEPTDTLVLSVNGYYVDLRVTKEDQSIDWALAGERIVLSEDPLRVKFTHPLDSHLHDVDGSGEEPEPDVGDFTQLPNGDKLETGQMAAPHLGGQIMPYEEIWRSLDFAINRTSAVTNPRVPFAFVLESTNSKSVATRTGSKTFYARAGRFFLGIRGRVIQAQTDTSPTSTSAFVFDAIYQEFDDVNQFWDMKYMIGNSGDMWKLSNDDKQMAAHSHPTGNWTPNDTILLENNETYIIRAVAES